jgi:hypothetical protein
MQELHVGASIATAPRLSRPRSPHEALQSATKLARLAYFDVEIFSYLGLKTRLAGALLLLCHAQYQDLSD